MKKYKIVGNSCKHPFKIGETVYAVGLCSYGVKYAPSPKTKPYDYQAWYCNDRDVEEIKEKPTKGFLRTGMIYIDMTMYTQGSKTAEAIMEAIQKKCNDNNLDVIVCFGHKPTNPMMSVEDFLTFEEKPSYEGVKVDLSWLRGEARQVMARAIIDVAKKNGYYLASSSTDKKYIFICKALKSIHCFKNGDFTKQDGYEEISANAALKGEYK